MTTIIQPMRRTCGGMLLALLLTLIAGLGVRAEGSASISFESEMHDFGTIKADGGRVRCTYEFTNTGDAPLVIINVTNGGCGCTRPTFPREPIAPGAKGTVSISFDPKAFRGEISRTVKVTTNGKPRKVKLGFKAVIIPAQQ